MNRQQQKDHAIYIKVRILNCLLAGFLVFMGAFTDGRITKAELIMSIGASALVFAHGLRELLADEEKFHRVHPALFHFF